MLRNPLSLTLALAIAGSFAVAIPAGAQSMQSYLPRRLTTSDVAILREEAAKLGPNGPKEDTWHNPKTGHSGTVTFDRDYRKAGMECRSFSYKFYTGTSIDGLPYKLDWCQKPDGQWAIANG